MILGEKGYTGKHGAVESSQSRGNRHAFILTEFDSGGGQWPQDYKGTSSTLSTAHSKNGLLSTCYTPNTVKSPCTPSIPHWDPGRSTLKSLIHRLSGETPRGTCYSLTARSTHVRRVNVHDAHCTDGETGFREAKRGGGITNKQPGPTVSPLRTAKSQAFPIRS